MYFLAPIYKLLLSFDSEIEFGANHLNDAALEQARREIATLKSQASIQAQEHEGSTNKSEFAREFGVYPQHVNKLLNDGYDAYEAGDYEAAMKKFETVLAINPEHDGAAIGCARSQFKLGDTEAAALMVHRLPVEGTASVSAIRGLCLAANSHYELAVASFRTAIADGLESRELLTDLAYCLCQSAQPKEAVEVLERVRRMGHDTSIANLILVRAYQMKWRQRIKGEKRPEFDTELLVNLIEECKESPARSHTAAIFYSSLASRFGRTDESVRSHWTKKAQSEFARGCELGLDPSYADDIKHVNRELITAIQHSPKSTLQHRVFYLLDPLTGTRFERCTEQSLARHH